MNNLANTPTPLSPEESYLASKLVGKSLFSAIQLTREMERMKALEEHERNDVLKIPIPVQKAAEEKQANDIEGQPPGIIGRALRFNRNPIRTLVGGEAGFSEGRREYYDMEKRQIQKELEAAQAEYLDTLQRIKHGEETPHVDAFCNGMATELTIPELSKEATRAEDVEIGDGSIKRLVRNALGLAVKPVQPALDLGATGLLGTAGGTGYLAYILKKKMREKDQDSYTESELPTRVELVPFQSK